ncbi:MAG: hypothetical protein U5K56_03520 [Halioglobus sp.]|nr:hypothetical protein [Halioglobus sp.]
MKSAITALAVCVALLQGCAQYQDKRGVEVSWRDSVTRDLVSGQSTRADVLSLLGPPSQVIAMDDETALYYLFEHSEGRGLVLLVYNRMEIDTRYDRAIFFFNEDDVLKEYATHIHEADRD